jgi:type IV fimbrial biogenesis protein FimT
MAAGNGARSLTRRCRHSRAQGFSLLELMVVLSVVAILLAIGVPGFQSLRENLQLSTTVNAFLSAVNLTRSEAIHRGARVDLVPRNGANWQQGWVVFIDENRNQMPDGDEQVIVWHGPVSGNIAINSQFSDSTKPYLAYNGSGRTRTHSSNQSPQLGTVSFFLNGKIRRIKLNFSGRARICNPENDQTCSGAGDTT